MTVHGVVVMLCMCDTLEEILWSSATTKETGLGLDVSPLKAKLSSVLNLRNQELEPRRPDVFIAQQCT